MSSFLISLLIHTSTLPFSRCCCNRCQQKCCCIKQCHSCLSNSAFQRVNNSLQPTFSSFFLLCIFFPYSYRFSCFIQKSSNVFSTIQRTKRYSSEFRFATECIFLIFTSKQLFLYI